MKWLAPAVLCVLAACQAESNDLASNPKTVEPGVLLIGQIASPRLTESSGIVVSRRDPALFWTHNDGGGKRQVLYAIGRDGKSIGEYRVAGVSLDDWEDIATDGKGHLFIADVGNNNQQRASIAVHQIDEPDPRAATSGSAVVTRSWNLRYPAAPFDCESLFVWGDYGYLISKVFNDARAAIYRFSLTQGSEAQTLEPVGEIRIDSPVTGADISPDGKLLGVVAKNGAYVFGIQGDVARAAKGKPYQNKFKHDHVEACAFVPEGLLATAESREIFLFTDEAFRTGPTSKKKSQ